ncbi:MAG: monovalent cation/H+ antiporter subunit D [Pseudomonadota bacterium]
MTHWIIVPVVLPAMLGALILLFAKSLAWQRAWSLAGTFALWGLACALLAFATLNGPEVYRLGNWPAPFGIVLMLDRLSGLMVWITATLALIAQIYAVASGWDARGKHFHSLWQFQLMGLCGAFLTGDAFNLFVFFEVLLIASYGLMVHGGGSVRTRAGVQYVAVNLLGSTLFLFALATVYAVTGTLNMADLAVKLTSLPAGDAGLMRAACVLLMLVFAIKGALVPVQFWLPGTYAAAPGVVAALFAVMTKVGAYAVLRFGTLVFPASSPVTGGLVGDLLLPAALATLIIGAVGVLGASTLPRMVAFAAIASMGTLFTAIAGFTPASTAAALYYALHATFATAAMFLIADLVATHRGRLTLTGGGPGMAGILAALFLAAAIGMAGMPPLSGFIGKLLVLQALRDQAGLVWPVVLITSLITMVGFGRAGSSLFWKTEGPGIRPAPWTLAPPLLLLALLAALTAFAGPVTDWTMATAAYLHDPAAYIAANTLYEVPQ